MVALFLLAPIIREITDKRISKDYLWSVLRNQICLQQMLQRSSGGNYPAITEPELKLIMISVPSEKIQEAIASELNCRRAEDAPPVQSPLERMAGCKDEV